MLTKMKIALVLCGSLICGVAAAQPGAGGAVDKADRKAAHQAKKAEMLKQFDTNRNGTLEDTERTAMHESRVLERFKKLDTDGNGMLSLAEFKAGKHGKMGKHMGRGGKHARFGHGQKRGVGGGLRDTGTR